MKPNILLICCDQQRWDCLGFNHRYPVRTPNLDRLAAEGTRFDHSYTPLPTCCPARQALVCGQRPERFGALWNYGTENPPVQTLEKTAFSWARSLQEQGYQNAYIGKWHVSPVYSPLDFGYDTYIGHEVLDMHVHAQYGAIQWQGGWMGETCPYDLEDSYTHQTAKHVISMIDQYGQGPWHIRMDFADPHLPCRPSEPFASMYGDEDVPKWDAFDDPLEGKPYIQRQMQRNWNTQDMTWEECRHMVRRYYGLISQIDDAIGRVIRHLEQTGQLDNTVIIYTADHGDMCGSRRMMDKHYVLYDDVVRVPLVIRYPKQVRQNAVSDDFVINMLDLAPTILELAGASVPEGLDGISLLPYLEGKQSPEARKYALSTYNGQQFGLYTQRMLRNHRWKYIWNPTDTDELYDMEQDPYELHNLAHAPACQELLKQMRLDLLEELRKFDDSNSYSSWLIDQLKYNRKL